VDDHELLSVAKGDDVRRALSALGQLRRRVRELEEQVVRQARAEGLTWEEIAKRLDRVRSTVWERYNPPGEEGDNAPDADQT
jgi:DNA-directed RNA polymerase specialized sigma24 family protein